MTFVFYFDWLIIRDFYFVIDVIIMCAKVILFHENL